LEGLASLRALWERRIRATTEEAERQRCNRERRSLGRLSAAWEHRISVAKLRELLVTVDGRVVLKVLKLDWEKLPVALEQLPAMHEWQIHRTQLHSLPPNLGAFGSLLTLDLSRNRIHCLPPQIGQLSRLRELSLSYNALESVPPELSQCRELQRLELSANQGLHELPDELGSLPSLYHVDLSVNSFPHVPSALLRLAALEWLDLSSNRLEGLPSDLSSWERLHSLWLQRNLLQALPESLCRLRSLTTLVLSGNRLRQLPLAMEAMTGLTFVNLRDNPLEPAVTLPDPEEVEEVEKFGMDFMRHYLRTLRTEREFIASGSAAFMMAVSNELLPLEVELSSSHGTHISTHRPGHRRNVRFANPSWTNSHIRERDRQDRHGFLLATFRRRKHDEAVRQLSESPGSY
ncbi:uncharacterized protein LOC144948462, partial [Lampetra fluviatilis]